MTDTQTTNVPTTETIEAAARINLLNHKGEQVPFGDLFSSSKAIVVFIRHFFCGTCQAYVSQLAAVPEASLSESKVELAIIGCGDWELIDNYKKNTGYTGNIYADPSRELYHKLGMTTENLKLTPSGKEKRSYVPGTVSNILSSIWKGPVSHPFQLGKQVNISQLGGDFIFGPGNTCHFAHLMEHTEDHLEVADLMKEAGVKV